MSEDAAIAQDWPRVLEWAEKQGTESLKGRFGTAEILAKESQATLTVLLAGVGGSAAYAGKLFDAGSGSATTWGFAAACVYLMFLSVALVMHCMRFESYPALSQEPLNLMQHGYRLDALREVELENLTKRIGDATSINDRRAEALNKVRVAAALSPLVFVLAALLATPFAPASARPESVTITCVQLPPAVSAGESAAARPMTCRFGP